MLHRWPSAQSSPTETPLTPNPAQFKQPQCLCSAFPLHSCNRASSSSFLPSVQQCRGRGKEEHFHGEGAGLGRADGRNRAVSPLCHPTPTQAGEQPPLSAPSWLSEPFTPPLALSQPGSVSPPRGQVPICHQLQFLNISPPPSLSLLCPALLTPAGTVHQLRAAQGRMEPCCRWILPTCSKGKCNGSSLHILARVCVCVCMLRFAAGPSKGRGKACCLLSAWDYRGYSLHPCRCELVYSYQIV